MGRNVFGWSLPPGVTHKMIDDHFGGDPCECDELEHEHMLKLIREDGFSEEAAEKRAGEDRADGLIECEACADSRRGDEAEQARVDDAIDEGIARRRGWED